MSGPRFYKLRELAAIRAVLYKKFLGFLKFIKNSIFTFILRNRPSFNNSINPSIIYVVLKRHNKLLQSRSTNRGRVGYILLYKEEEESMRE